jgi:hypothetical protein
MEEARREILGVPDDYRGDSAEYLDFLAIERLQEITDMADSAPTPLARALIFKGRTRAGLAEALGVSETAIGHWASGEKPLPDSRVREVAVWLGVDPAGLVDATPAADTSDLTYFGWVVEHVIGIGYYGSSRQDVALKLGITLAKLRAYTHAGEVVPEDLIYRLTNAYLPKMAEKLSPRFKGGTTPTL